MARQKKDELTHADRECLHDLRTMFAALEQTYKSLDDKTGIDECLINFRGFDANDAHEWKLSRHYPSDFNSHWPMLPEYRAMVARWRGSADRVSLTKADLLRITERPWSEY
jgi:uncharacterized protein YfbU (UPF0304 family)